MGLNEVMSTASKLTDKQKRFCEEYLIDLNATQAAIRAGYSSNSASQLGSETLGKLEVQQHIAFLNEKRMKKVGVTPDFVLGELLKLASADPAEMYELDGSMKNIHDIPEHLRKTISRIEVVEYFEGKGENREQVGHIKRVAFWSKEKALENLGKHLKLFSDKVEIGTTRTLEQIIGASFQKRISDD